MKKATIFAVLFVFCGACATAPPPVTAVSVKPVAQLRQLSVQLYPYIPDAAGDNFTALKLGLKQQFEAQNPNIAVSIMINLADDPYDENTQAKLFAADGPNVVETDTLTLGHLVGNGYLVPVSFLPPVFPFAAQASQIDGITYAIPTWVCMYFHTAGPAKPGTGATPIANLAGLWDGSWTLPALYLAATASLHGYDSVVPATVPPLDPGVVAAMATLMAGCSAGGSNPCLNGTFKNGVPGAAQIQFAAGQYANVTGFSESTFYVLNQRGTPGAIVPMQFAPGQTFNRPLAFTDGLVVNRASCQNQCLIDANNFGEFLNTDSIRNYIVFSADAPLGTSPRYLSPAVNSFYQQASVQGNPLFQQFKQGFDAAQGYPNRAFPSLRLALNPLLCDALKTTIPDACPKKTPTPSQP